MKIKSKILNEDLDIREMELDDLSAVFSLGEQIFTVDKWTNL